MHVGLFSLDSGLAKRIIQIQRFIHAKGYLIHAAQPKPIYQIYQKLRRKKDVDIETMMVLAFVLRGKRTVKPNTVGNKLI